MHVDTLIGQRGIAAGAGVCGYNRHSDGRGSASLPGWPNFTGIPCGALAAANQTRRCCV